MNDIIECDSLYHFDIVSSIEKKFNKKFSKEEILKSSSTVSIYKIIKKITLN
jgi:acyl carrier protein